ncbi:unnamed protein product [Toxocara canis]|uniref:Transmembrane protein n=1 Tax=Toxocara canis TaxID=6265 RepID=A0A183V6M0_TOXCA|nr:unnamed protein product [Toxocara canis]
MCYERVHCAAPSLKKLNEQRHIEQCARMRYVRSILLCTAAASQLVDFCEAVKGRKVQHLLDDENTTRKRKRASASTRRVSEGETSREGEKTPPSRVWQRACSQLFNRKSLLLCAVCLLKLANRIKIMGCLLAYVLRLAYMLRLAYVLLIGGLVMKGDASKPQRILPAPRCQPISVEQCKDLPYNDTRSVLIVLLGSFIQHFATRSVTQLRAKVIMRDEMDRAG